MAHDIIKNMDFSKFFIFYLTLEADIWYTYIVYEELFQVSKISLLSAVDP